MRPFCPSLITLVKATMLPSSSADTTDSSEASSRVSWSLSRGEGIPTVQASLTALLYHSSRHRCLVGISRCFLKGSRVGFRRLGAGCSSGSCRRCLHGAVPSWPSGWMCGGAGPSGVEYAVAAAAPQPHRGHGRQGHLPCRLRVLRSWQDRTTCLRTFALAVR